MQLNFEPIMFGDGVILNYPSEQDQQFVVITEDDTLVHCISTYSWEDTASGPQPMLICIPFDDGYDRVIDFEHCKMVAYFD